MCRPTDKDFSSIIWNGFVALLDDTNYDVLLKLVKALLDIFKAFSRSTTEGLLNGSIAVLAAVRDRHHCAHSHSPHETYLLDSRLGHLRHSTIGVRTSSVRADLVVAVVHFVFASVRSTTAPSFKRIDSDDDSTACVFAHLQRKTTSVGMRARHSTFELFLEASLRT